MRRLKRRLCYLRDNQLPIVGHYASLDFGLSTAGTNVHFNILSVPVGRRYGGDNVPYRAGLSQGSRLHYATPTAVFPQSACHAEGCALSRVGPGAVRFCEFRLWWAIVVWTRGRCEEGQRVADYPRL